MKVLHGVWPAIFVVSMIASTYGIEQDRFVESFDGVGEFGSDNLGGPRTGLDNPGWKIFSTAEFADGGLRLPTENTANQLVWRSVLGSDSFRNEIQLRHVVLVSDNSAMSSAMILLNHTPGLDEGNSALGRLSIGVGVEAFSAPRVYVETGGRRPSPERIFYDVADASLFRDGTDVSLAIEFALETLDAYFEFDLDTNDDVPATMLGPFKYEGEVNDFQNTTFDLSRGFEVEQNFASGAIDSWSLSDFSALPGDYDRDLMLTSQDIDLLSEEVLANTNRAVFDTNSDGSVNADDRRIWVHDLKGTYFGDANLDGEFSRSDLVTVFEAAEYEDDIDLNSGWAAGDWNGDGDFTSRDLVTAFQDAGYEQGPRPAAHFVPEHSTSILAVLGLSSLTLWRRLL